MTRAVIYARYSPGPNQRTESIEAQVFACKKYCQDNGYELVRTPYTDEKKSGTTDDRPSFRRMIRDAKGGVYDVVVVHKIDRFARDRYDDAYYKRELFRAGVRRESVVERFGDTPEGEYVENIMADTAEYFIANLRRETKKGLAVNARDARNCGGRPPLGYDLDAGGHYVVNEAEAAAVRLVFRMYDKGHSYAEIVSALAPYRTKRGRPFRPTSVYEVLRNEKYIGRFVYNKRDASGKKSGRKRNNHAFRPKEEWIVVEDGCPAIVDRELWERVQIRMDERKHPRERARQNAKQDYLLAGLIQCGVEGCGRAYAGNCSFGPNAKERYSVYECGSRKARCNCGNLRIHKAWAESDVLDALHEEIFGRRKERIDEIMEDVERGKKEAAGEIEQARARVARLEGDLRNIIDAIRGGLKSKTLQAELDSLERQADAAREDLEMLQAKEEHRWTRAQIEAYYDRFEESFRAGAATKEEIRAILRRYVVKIIVRPDGFLETQYRPGGIAGADGDPTGIPVVSAVVPVHRKPRRY